MKVPHKAFKSNGGGAWKIWKLNTYPGNLTQKKNHCHISVFIGKYFLPPLLTPQGRGSEAPQEGMERDPEVVGRMAGQGRRARDRLRSTAAPIPRGGGLKCGGNTPLY